MKIQCNGCEAADAQVLCCADEAALCAACDEKVHAANKLASKHQRVPLVFPGADSGAPSVPKCDICQEASGYFFCLEDRALLCRTCDVVIHTANPHVSTHRRFLLTGIQVGLQPAEPVAPSADDCHDSTLHASSCKILSRRSRRLTSTETSQESPSDQVLADNSSSLQRKNTPSAPGDENKECFSYQVARNSPENFLPSGPMLGSLPDWSIDEFLGTGEFNDCFGFTDQTSPKADSCKLGSSEGSPFSLADDILQSDEFLGQVPEIWTVPDMPSPPTASGLHHHWRRSFHHPLHNDKAVFVPDMSSSDHSHAGRHSSMSPAPKRPRRR